ncbi:unnamed protein product [Acanthoscelides obtectus]|uniref:EGF-like domain-containing protein n=1 Tax=Acanthoscelides obtectus TaxID=200917 RepID=A0A9P0MKY1_ACAOB|nr:unnamed protein product [Acanthoscelides obtectus]CAK1629501.1 Cysteine-rich with EGF-like domain protein 2 [Acanthoscelides obtectus]
MVCWKIASLCFIISVVSHQVLSKSNTTKENHLPPCRACRNFIEYFKNAVQIVTNKTKDDKQAQFVEITKKLCTEQSDKLCEELMAKYSDKLEEWWIAGKEKHPNVESFICIETFKVCCPDLHYGPDCKPCSGYPNNVCNNNGKCKGSGTRKGNGGCLCDRGYTGEFCDKCSESHYEAYKDDKKLICAECHLSCEGLCTKAGPKGCAKCKPGFIMDKDKGCLDINECAARKRPCTPLQFCVNTEGDYRCLDCDRSCAGCSGDGPDMCIDCATGYEKKDKMCVDSGEQRRQNFVWYSRYLTYLGLCISTCIILNKNIYIAAVIGMCVGVYITVSEQTSSPTQNLEQQLADEIVNALNI